MRWLRFQEWTTSTICMCGPSRQGWKVPADTSSYRRNLARRLRSPPARAPADPRAPIDRDHQGLPTPRPPAPLRRRKTGQQVPRPNAQTKGSSPPRRTHPVTTQMTSSDTSLRGRNIVMPILVHFMDTFWSTSRLHDRVKVVHFSIAARPQVDHKRPVSDHEKLLPEPTKP